MKKFKTLISMATMLLIIISVFATLSCEKQPEMYKIGAILPLTGNVAWLGENAKNGIQLAIEEINSSGGIKGKKLEIIFEDSKLEPKEGVAIANRLVDIEKVNALIVNGTTIVNAVMPITEQKNILLFAQTIHPGITGKGQNIFRIYGGGDYEWKMLAKYINDNNLNVGIFYINAQYGIDSKKMLTKNLAPKIKVVFEESYEIGAADFRSILMKVKNKKADAVVLMGYGTEFIVLLKQMKELGFKTRVLGNIDFTFDFLQKAPMCQGAIFVAPSFSVGILTEKGTEFLSKYVDRFKNKPSWDIANSYETIIVLAEAIAQIGRWDLEQIKNYLLNLKDYSGVSGKFTIGANKDAVFDLYMATLKDSKIVPLE